MSENITNADYIRYLNSLHSYNAGNSNSYGESNIKNSFFKEVMVDVEICDFILEKIKSEQPHIIILTGHAGDGKTSIMHQFFQKAGISVDVLSKTKSVWVAEGKKCFCIKDFSEFSEEERRDLLKDVLNRPNNGEYVFMVANTGPLINTFGEMFDEGEKREKAKIELINAMDANDGNIKKICGNDMCVINVAKTDNTYFATEFLEKLINPQLWDKCMQCAQKEYCHILRNKEIIKNNKSQVREFINNHFIWLNEHGERLTIRSMTEQLAFMFTGGVDCEGVKKVAKEHYYKYLFSNLFFGYYGTEINEKASGILAVNTARKCRYEYKRMRADESLILNQDFENIFDKDIAAIVSAFCNKYSAVKGSNEFLRRTYIFLNRCEYEKEIKKRDMEDIFSRRFQRFVELSASDKKTAGKEETNLVCDALSMIYTGVIDKDEITLTLCRYSGIKQNVQLSIGKISRDDVDIELKKAPESGFIGRDKKMLLFRHEYKGTVDFRLTLPMLDYFDELRRGVIETDIDPQLSQGIENFKTQIEKKFANGNRKRDCLEILVSSYGKNKKLKFEIDNDNLSME